MSTDMSTDRSADMSADMLVPLVGRTEIKLRLANVILANCFYDSATQLIVVKTVNDNFPQYLWSIFDLHYRIGHNKFKAYIDRRVRATYGLTGGDVLFHKFNKEYYEVCYLINIHFVFYNNVRTNLF